MLRSRALQAFIVVVIVGAFLFPFVSPMFQGPAWTYFMGVFVVAAGIGIGSAVMATRQSGASGMRTWATSSEEFLCDSCKYDNDRDCRQPDRPNAVTCPDFKRR